MTKQELLNELKELTELNGKPYSFFLSWKTAPNIESRVRDKITRLYEFITKMEESSECIEGNLPFDLLCIYFNTCVVVFRLDKDWNGVDYGSWESHDIFAVPFVDVYGNWLYLNGTTNTEYLTEE